MPIFFSIGSVKPPQMTVVKITTAANRKESGEFYQTRQRACVPATLWELQLLFTYCKALWCQ